MKKKVIFENGEEIEVEYDPRNCSHPAEYWETDIISSYGPEPSAPEEIFICGLCGKKNCDIPDRHDDSDWDEEQADGWMLGIKGV